MSRSRFSFLVDIAGSEFDYFGYNRRMGERLLTWRWRNLPHTTAAEFAIMIFAYWNSAAFAGEYQVRWFKIVFSDTGPWNRRQMKQVESTLSRNLWKGVKPKDGDGKISWDALSLSLDGDRLLCFVGKLMKALNSSQKACIST